MRGGFCLAFAAALAASALAVTGVAGAAGETIRVEDGLFLTNNDPLNYEGTSGQILSLTCARLYGYPDLEGAAGYVAQPEVATGLPAVSADGLTVTIGLQHGWGFSPPSTEQVTAQSFVRAIQRWQGLDGGTSYETSAIASATAAGDYELVLTLTRPLPNLVEELTSQPFCATPSDVPLDAFVTDPTVPMAGPYYIASASTAPQEFVLKQNPNYGGTRIRNLGEIDWYGNVPTGTAVADVEAGTADYAPTIGGADFASLDAQYGPASQAAADGHQQFFSSQASLTAFVGLNTSAGRVFANESLRRAVAYAVDRSAFASTAVNGPATPTDQILPPGFPGFQDWSIFPFTADPVAAMSLASEAGVDPDHPITVKAYFKLPGAGRSITSTAESLLTEELGPLGIDLEIHEIQGPPFFGFLDTQGADYDLALWAWAADYADPYDFLNVLLDGNSIQATGNTNFSYFDDPSFNAQLDQAAALDPGAARLSAYAALDRDLSAAAALVPVYNANHPDLFSARIGCQVFQPIFGMNVNNLCVRVAAPEPAGGTLATGTDATSDAPLQTSLTTPNAGPVSIQQGVATATVTNYQLLQQQLTISAPDATVAAPLQLAFTLDGSVVGSTDPATIDVIRDGVPVQPCADSTGQANPDPCLASRTPLAGGDLRLVVLSSHASRWNFGILLDRPPVCTSAAASPATLWPPDGRLVPVTIGGVTDPDGDPVTVTATSVTQTEPGHDSAITSSGASVRATRLGEGSGRVYTISFTASDGRGGSCSGAVRVTVPHDQGH